MVRKWDKVSSEFLIENKIFKLREDKVISPKKESEHPVWVIDTPNWVNIIPIDFIETFKLNSIYVSQISYVSKKDAAPSTAMLTAPCHKQHS